MRYPASEKLEIIRLVEESHLSARQTLAKLGIPRTTFYRWYDRYLQRGEASLQDQSPKPKHVWNRVPDEVIRKVVHFALKETELSPRELAITFTDQEGYFVSESTVYRVLKAHECQELCHTYIFPFKSIFLFDGVFIWRQTHPEGAHFHVSGVRFASLAAQPNVSRAEFCSSSLCRSERHTSFRVS